MHPILKTLTFLMLLTGLCTVATLAQASSGTNPKVTFTPDTGRSVTSGTALSVQWMTGGGMHSYVYGLRGFSDHHLFQLQFKSRSDYPDKPYQVSLKHERWTEVALLYGYRFSSATFRLHGSAGPAYISSEKLGKFISSVVTERRLLYDNKIGRDWWYTERTQEDTYEVLSRSSAGLVFDAGIGSQFSRTLFVGIGVHGAVTPHDSEIGYTLTLGYGLF